LAKNCEILPEKSGGSAIPGKTMEESERKFSIKPSKIAQWFGVGASNPRASFANDYKSHVSGDQGHIIHLPENVTDSPYDYVHVFLVGTGGPVLDGSSHATQFLSICGEYRNIPTIALSYEWVALSDKAKNERIEKLECSPADRSNILRSYHQDVCFGGGSSGLTTVVRSESVTQRLLRLLMFLCHDGPNASKWTQLLAPRSSSADDNTTEGGRGVDMEVNWPRVILSGHSQGAGHAAFLGQRFPLARLVLLSGPQESLLSPGGPIGTDGAEGAVGTDHWLCDPFETRDVVALKHNSEEGTSKLIDRCLALIPPLAGQKACIIRSHADCADSDLQVQSRIFVSHLAPANPAKKSGQQQARPCHCSTIYDAFTPRAAPVAGGAPTYAYMQLWTRLLFQGLGGSVSRPASVLKEAPRTTPSWFTWFFGFYNENYFMFTAILAIVFAFLVPDLGRRGGYLASEYTVYYMCNILVFLISGLTLKSKVLVESAKNWKLHAAIQANIFGTTVGLFYGLSRLLSMTSLSQALIDGLVILGCLPTTINMCVVLTTSADGTTPSALFDSTLANILGIFITPAYVFEFLGAESSVSFVDVIVSLMIKV
jgi:hypothetical protein